MRLYEGLIPTIARDIARKLLSQDALEVAPGEEAELEMDVQAVLREYVRTEREINRDAREMAARQGSGANPYKIRQRLAKERGFALGEDSLEYIIFQLIEAFFHSNFVEEVFAEDPDLRRYIAPVLRKHMEEDEKLDREVRSKIKNLEEGSKVWDIEYQKVMEKIRRSKKLE